VPALQPPDFDCRPLYQDGVGYGWVGYGNVLRVAQRLLLDSGLQGRLTWLTAGTEPTRSARSPGTALLLGGASTAGTLPSSGP
jgi:hypothetical protein